MENSKIYNVEIVADNHNDCLEALQLLQKLLHTFKEGMSWKSERFHLNVKVGQISSQDK